MSKYQRMDSEVLSQLDSIVSNNKDLTDDQKKDYKNLIERQYQNISYKIKALLTSKSFICIVIIGSVSPGNNNKAFWF